MKRHYHKVNKNKYFIWCEYCGRWYKWIRPPQGGAQIPKFCWRLECQKWYNQECYTDRKVQKRITKELHRIQMAARKAAN